MAILELPVLLEYLIALSLSLSTIQVCIISNMYNVVRHFFGIVFTEQPKYLWGGELRLRMHVLMCTDAIHMHVYTCIYIHAALNNSPQYPSLLSMTPVAIDLPRRRRNWGSSHQW